MTEVAARNATAIWPGQGEATSSAPGIPVPPTSASVRTASVRNEVVAEASAARLEPARNASKGSTASHRSTGQNTFGDEAAMQTTRPADEAADALAAGTRRPVSDRIAAAKTGPAKASARTASSR